MLKNILINAGEWTPSYTQGKHINVVLAAGEISARINLSNGQTFETKLVSGMSFPVLEGYEAVYFYSEASQQTKIWLGNLPLTYSPIDSKAVGSSALISKTGSVFSGAVTQLLKAESGRNKITLIPENDILIGGVGLNLTNAIKVNAGQTFALQTQGAIYATEESGNFPPYYTGEFNENQIKSPFVISTGSMSGAYATQIENQILVIGQSQASSFSRYNTETGDYEGAINMFRPMSGNRPFLYGEKVIYGGKGITGSGGYLMTLDLESLTPSYEKITDDTGIFNDVSANGDFIVVFDGNPHKLRYKIANGTWQIGSASIENTNAGNTVVKGVVVDNDNNVFILNENGLYKTSDKGDSWEALSIPAGVDAGIERSFMKDEVTGHIYLATIAGLKVSYDSCQTWSNVDMGLSDFKGLSVRGGVIAVTGGDGSWSVSFGDGYVKGKHANSTSQRGLDISTNGQIYMGFGSNEVYVIKGDKLAVGGLSVAIMAEVN